MRSLGLHRETEGLNIPDGNVLARGIRDHPLRPKASAAAALNDRSAAVTLDGLHRAACGLKKEIGDAFAINARRHRIKHRVANVAIPPAGYVFRSDRRSARIGLCSSL